MYIYWGDGRKDNWISLGMSLCLYRVNVSVLSHSLLGEKYNKNRKIYQTLSSLPHWPPAFVKDSLANLVKMLKNPRQPPETVLKTLGGFWAQAAGAGDPPCCLVEEEKKRERREEMGGQRRQEERKREGERREREREEIGASFNRHGKQRFFFFLFSKLTVKPITPSKSTSLNELDKLAQGVQRQEDINTPLSHPVHTISILCSIHKCPQISHTPLPPTTNTAWNTCSLNYIKKKKNFPSPFDTVIKLLNIIISQMLISQNSPFGQELFLQNLFRRTSSTASLKNLLLSPPLWKVQMLL